MPSLVITVYPLGGRASGGRRVTVSIRYPRSMPSSMHQATKVQGPCVSFGVHWTLVFVAVASDCSRRLLPPWAPSRDVTVWYGTGLESTPAHAPSLHDPRAVLYTCVSKSIACVNVCSCIPLHASKGLAREKTISWAKFCAV